MVNKIDKGSMFMNLLKEKVTHRVFGKGKVVSQNESIITIDFENDSKRFVYPDAFGKFITLKNQDVADSLNEVISEKQEQEALLAKKEEEEKQKIALEQERQQQLADRKIHESSQIAFWLDEQEQENVFNDWSSSTGEVQSGPNKGRPNRAARLRSNSAALLTVRPGEQEESNRRIIGLYMVPDMFAGNEDEDGMVPAHENYRLQLTEEESEKMLFWKYYKNNRNPERMIWNSGKYRYYDNVGTVQILNDLIALRTDETAIAEAKNFLDYFIEMNLINTEEIPEADGALK